MITLPECEAEVAYSMVVIGAQESHSAFRPLQRFLCFWTAFNNIYVKVAKQKNCGPKLERDGSGAVVCREIDGVHIPKVKPIKEITYIKIAFDEFSDELKHRLIVHQNVGYFVDRTPVWYGQKIETDARGQRLNGVLNVGFTTDVSYPVWSPINTRMYEAYLKDQKLPEVRNKLAWQILQLIYTVRNNLFHGFKMAEDRQNQELEVVDKALPLLEIIVYSFIPNAVPGPASHSS